MPSGSENEGIAFFYLASKGLSNEQSAGVVGNMIAESGVNPRRVQSTPTPEGDRDTPPTGSRGYGLVQWTPGTKILPDAEAMNKPPGDMQFQLDLLWEQLEGRSAIPEKSAGDHLKSQTTVDGAARSFMTRYERPANQSEGKQAERARLAEGVFYRYAGQIPTNNFSNSGSCTASGGGQTLGDFVLYNQYDPQWADKPYGSSTIAISGCGPSSVAMVVATLVDRNVNPETIATRFSNLYVPDEGSSWALMTEGPEAYGLSSTDIGTNMSAATEALREGKYVIATGQGVKPFITSGHILVLRGISDSGKILIGDSGHTDTSTQEHEASELAASITNMWVISE